MERITETTETITKKIHEFYCDDCECLIGTSEEYPDNGYLQYGICEFNILTPQGTYECYNKCLCDNCKNTLFEGVTQALEELGFTYHAKI